MPCVSTIPWSNWNRQGRRSRSRDERGSPPPRFAGDGAEVKPARCLGGSRRRAVGTRPAAHAATAAAQPPAQPQKETADGAISPGHRRLLARSRSSNRKTFRRPAEGSHAKTFWQRPNAEQKARPTSLERVTRGAARFDAQADRRALDALRSGRAACDCDVQANLSAVITHRDAHKAAFERQAQIYLHRYFVRHRPPDEGCARSQRRWFRIASKSTTTSMSGWERARRKGLDRAGDRPRANAVLGSTSPPSDELTEKARGGKIDAGDVRTARFRFPITASRARSSRHPSSSTSPIAILGIGKVQKRAVVREVHGADEIEVRRCLCHIDDRPSCDRRLSNERMAHALRRCAGDLAQGGASNKAAGRTERT